MDGCPAGEKNALGQALKHLISCGVKTFVGPGHSALQADAAAVREESWRSLLAEQERLLGAARRGLTNQVEGLSAELVVSLRDALESVRQPAHLFKERVVTEIERSNNMTPTHALRIGCGSPARMGCADVSGKHPKYTPLTDTECGAFAAMKALNLDILGLPGARLRPEYTPPMKSGIGARARWSGGTSYASVAVLWRKQLAGNFLSRTDIGSNRRLWSIILCHGDTPINLCVFY